MTYTAISAANDHLIKKLLSKFTVTKQCTGNRDRKLNVLQNSIIKEEMAPKWQRNRNSIFSAGQITDCLVDQRGAACNIFATLYIVCYLP